MKISVVVVGELQTNCYIIEKGNSVLIIDPGDNASLIASNISSDKRVIMVIIYVKVITLLKIFLLML